MRIIHFGDIHFWDIGMAGLDIWPKRFLGPLNLILRRRRKFPPGYAEAVARRILEEDADLVIFSGDVSTLSRESEFRAGAGALQPIRDKWGERFFLIPGNHDSYTPVSVIRRGFERHFPWGAFPGGKPVRTLVLSDRLAVMGFECSGPRFILSTGKITLKLEAALTAELSAQEKAGRRVLLVGHYPYALPPGSKDPWEHRLVGADRLARLAARFNPPVYFHGHKHTRWAIRPPASPATLCLNCGSAGMRDDENPMRQAGYLKLEVQDDGSPVNVQAVTLDGAPEAPAFQETQITLPD